MSYFSSSSTASWVEAALSRTRRMAKVVPIVGFPLSWRVGLLSNVRTAMDTPFSLIPSRQTNGAVRQASFSLKDEGFFVPMLSRAAKPIEEYPSFGSHLTSIADVSFLKS